MYCLYALMPLLAWSVDANVVPGRHTCCSWRHRGPNIRGVRNLAHCQLDRERPFTRAPIYNSDDRFSGWGPVGGHPPVHLQSSIPPIPQVLMYLRRTRRAIHQTLARPSPRRTLTYSACRRGTTIRPWSMTPTPDAASRTSSSECWKRWNPN